MPRSPRKPRPGGADARARRGRPGAAGEAWIYGRHAVLAALANPDRSIRRVVVTAEAEGALRVVAPRPGLEPEVAEARAIAALLPDGAVHQGFAALAGSRPPIALEDVLARLGNDASACVLVLDRVSDPRNTGAILRSAAAFGAAAVIVPERGSPMETPALAKAASGALETVALIRVANLARALETLKRAGFWCIGLDAAAPAPLAEADLTGRIALVLGSEGRGLRRLVADHCDLLAALPTGAAMPSLNVSAAAAIALYEAARQRR